MSAAPNPASERHGSSSDPGDAGPRTEPSPWRISSDLDIPLRLASAAARSSSSSGIVMVIVFTGSLYIVSVTHYMYRA